MKPDTLIRSEGMEIHAKHLGLVRFIMLMQKEPFDYTKMAGKFI